MNASEDSKRKLIIFDLDGTLISVFEFHARCVDKVVSEVWGIKNNLSMRERFGIPQRETLRRICRKGGVSETECLAGIPIAMELLPSEMARSLPEDLTSFVLPGVFPLLDTLSTRSGTSLSLATGTIQATAEILLERSHLLSYFQVCAFGSECNHRSELVLIALTRAFEYFKLDADQTCVITIGDATSDIEAGRSIGAKTVAVASGSIKRSELEEISPDLILDDFREYQRASNAILSL